MVDLNVDYAQKVFGEYLGIQNEECLALVRKQGKIRCWDKEEIIFPAGKVQPEIPFLLEGSYWCYIEVEPGIRHMECVDDTIYFPMTPQASLEEFMQPLPVTMQALEPVTAFSVPTELILQIVTTYPEGAAAMANLVMSSLQLHRRYQEWNALTLKQRYESFCEFYPGLSERLTKTVISQLLNTSIPALSRALKE